ncbi:MAG: autophagy protein 13 [Candelina submexicana]|nr:MAG: autophagy protein 13 [Candelina submexicana]
MHQHPRSSPVTASPALSPRTNPTRTNNPREQERNRQRSNPNMDALSERDDGLSDAVENTSIDQHTAGPSREANAKMNQIIQNYHTKAALIIISSRATLPPAFAKGSDTRRVNKWFNVEIDETDALRDDLRTWKTCDAIDPRPPPLVIETYLDTEDLTNNQTLVIIDDQGKRWDVLEALNSSGTSGAGKPSRPRRTEVILERWNIELGDPPEESPADLGAILPTIYKKSIVLFRSLFTYSKFLPAWKFSKRLSKVRSNHGALRVHYRVLQNGLWSRPSNSDGLNIPLFEGVGRTVDTFSFGATDSPAGAFSIQVSYRTNCDFRVDDSEALLSSHFMGIDEHFFTPSLGRDDDHQPAYLTRAKEVGSLPSEKRDLGTRGDRGQAYGSMSTFHQVGPPASSSPISALRAARDREPQSSSPSPPQKPLPNARSNQGSRPSSQGAPAMPRRTSISFQPFKTPSLSASPLQGENTLPSSPRGSLGRTSTLSALAQARNQAAGNVMGPPPSKRLSNPPDNAIASSASGSPKPAPIAKYTSSFGNRRARLSSGGGSKTEDDNNSSGKASAASSAAQPGSGGLAEAGGASSESIQTDDDNISDFLKMLDTKKDLIQAPTDPAAVVASTRRTTAALTKFQRMQASNAALSDSMSSSLMLHRSSSSSSRQLSSVPPMVAGTSLSTSSSPGKPVSPHTPHTPAIPSRLSANSVVDYAPHRSRSAARARPSSEDQASQVADVPGDDGARDPSTNAIDIPTSPRDRPYQPHNRRSSSVAHQHRSLAVEDEMGDLLPFNIRSASMGTDDRPPLSLSALLALQETSDVALAPAERIERNLQGTVNPEETSAPMTRQGSSSLESRDESTHHHRISAATSLNSPYRHRFVRGGGRGMTPPQGSSSSLAGDRGSGSGTSDHRGGRYSFTRPGNFEEDEPLLFTMSELGTQQSRRSLEEARGGSSVAASGRGGGDSGVSSRRGSRGGLHNWAQG